MMAINITRGNIVPKRFFQTRIDGEKEESKRVFSCLVYIMAKTGYVIMDFVAIDGMKIKADASSLPGASTFRNQRHTGISPRY